MYKLRYNTEREVPQNRRHDCKKIVEALYCRGVHISMNEAYEAWDNYSDSLCAGWIILPKTSGEICDILLEEEYIDEADD